MRDAVRVIDASVPVYGVRTYDSLLAESTAAGAKVRLLDETVYQAESWPTPTRSSARPPTPSGEKAWARNSREKEELVTAP